MKMKTQIPDWTGEEEWYSVKDDVVDEYEAAKDVVRKYIWDEQMYSLIGQEPITVRVDTGMEIVIIEVVTEIDFNCWATKIGKIAK